MPAPSQRAATSTMQASLSVRRGARRHVAWCVAWCAEGTALGFGAALLLFAAAASAEATPVGEPTSQVPEEPPVADPNAPLLPGTAAGPPVHSALDPEHAPPPPPTNVYYLQYGVSLGAEVVNSAGPICNNVDVPCILGTGGGITVRAGWRSSGPWYVGGSYGFSKQDPNKLLRLAILQQTRAELRYYFSTARDIEPYLMAGLGAAAYGDEWSIDTFGPAGSLGVAAEVQITRRTVVGLAAGYRLVYLKTFTDSAGATRSGGVAQFLGLDLILEQRDPVFKRGRR